MGKLELFLKFWAEKFADQSLPYYLVDAGRLSHFNKVRELHRFGLWAEMVNWLDFSVHDLCMFGCLFEDVGWSIFGPPTG